MRGGGAIWALQLAVLSLAAAAVRGQAWRGGAFRAPTHPRHPAAAAPAPAVAPLGFPEAQRTAPAPAPAPIPLPVPLAAAPEGPLRQARPAPAPPPVAPAARPPANPRPLAPDSEAAARLRQEAARELFQQQAESARYSFDSSVNDGILGHSHVRQETREGLKLTGMYAYSDGYYERTVHYVADENGYRVTKEEAKPIGNGPLVDLSGSANVKTNIDGITNSYTIYAADIPNLKE